MSEDAHAPPARGALTADGVFSGGGIKGLAFGGALAAAEEAGYTHWHELAGTSAGAITAMALAVGYDARGIREALDRFDFNRLADFGLPVQLIGGGRLHRPRAYGGVSFRCGALPRRGGQGA